VSTNTSIQGANKQPIVCGTDFSACAAEAADIAAALAHKLGTKLVLVNSEETRGLDPKLVELIVTEKQRDLNRAAERLRRLGIEVKEHLSSGSAFDGIVDLAEQSNAWLVVIGAVGHGLARRILIGSVAERVAETSPVPTLVVRPNSQLLPWVRGETRLKILAGDDFSATADAALQWVAQLRAIGDFSLIVVHIQLPGERQHTEQELIDRVTKIIPPQQFAVRLVPCWGHCEGALFETAALEDVDLVVVGTHQRPGFQRIRLGSVSRAVLHHATRSVVVVAQPRERAEVP
jgi:nucleotide-binding universal stress UspA family protein